MMGVLTSGFSSTPVGQTEARSLDYAIHKMIEKYAHVSYFYIYCGTSRFQSATLLHLCADKGTKLTLGTRGFRVLKHAARGRFF